jgi:hypothetical protein
MEDSPNEYKQADLLMTISGAVQVISGAFMVVTGLTACLASYGLCCFCPFIGLVPIGIGTHELIVANQMRQGIKVPNAKGANLAGLISAVLTLSVINIILEALAMAQLGNPVVAAYLEDRPEYEPIEG